jgi:GMP synthase (glutamine-hydrolysing)
MTRHDSIVLVVHQEQSDPGRIGAMLAARGLTLDIRRPACGDALPERFDAIRGAVVFGGPMSANDDHLSFIRQELDWLGRVRAAGLPFLGICLGAQLMARAGGAAVAPRADDRHEIGYVEIAPTPPGRDYFPAPLSVYHWHGEGFGLPDGAVRLAASPDFPNQAVRFAPRAYGLQFHPEVTGAMMKRWQVRAAAKLVKPGAQPPAAQRAAWARHDAGVARWCEGFLDRWLAS